jgi:hypothetical protein
MAGKASVGDRASQFLSQIGTAGGPVGAMTAPNLVTYGAGNIQEQLVAGNSDQYARQRGAGSTAVIGSPHNQAVPMPANLSDGYLMLNQQGSPLPMYGLMAPHNTKAAQLTQDSMLTMDQRMMTGMMPFTGQLPIGNAVAAAQQMGAKAAQQRARG